jgi:methionyl-tRNA synthetase
MEDKHFYISTPIYYPSAKAHIGHALTTVLSDALVRYKKMRGYETFFLTGMDEHGQKVARAAKEAGKTPQAHVDEMAEMWSGLWKALLIENDDFIRTTQKRHATAVQKIFQRIWDKGDIYLSEYEGWYCTPCETFFTERQLTEARLCPDCGRPVELVKEEAYFFKMSHYQERLLEHIEQHPDFIQPASRRHEMVNFIQNGLEDLSVSRTTFDWGIPTPINPKHVIYVWFDALSNYITALGWGSDQDERYRKFWPCDVHLVGKDIVRFHTIIWPAMLLAADLPLPKQVFGHGWVMLDSGKMSKSKGNVVDPLILIEKYGPEAIRYFLLREIPSGADGYYAEVSLAQRINTDLANDFGNLVSRSVAMVQRFFDGIVPAPAALSALDLEIQALAATVVEEAGSFMDKLDFANGLASVFRLIGRANKYIDETMPWQLAKDPSQKARLGTVLYHLLETVRIAALLLSPAMPLAPGKVWAQIGADPAQNQTWDDLKWGGTLPGAQVRKGENLFPRILWDEQEPEKPLPVEKTVSINDFKQTRLKVARVTACEKVEKTDKLLKLTVDLGEEARTIVSGIAQYYEPDALIGKHIVVAANLAPVKLRGIVSQGMILTAGDDRHLEVLTVSGHIPPGTEIS